MSERSDGQLGLGDLWRDVVNTLGDEPVAPARILTLLDAVAPRWAGAHHFMQFVAEHLADPSKRTEIETEIACATIGWRLWQEQREALWRWMQAASRRPVESGDLPEWWLGGRWGAMAVEEQAQMASFIKAIEWLPEERARIGLMRQTRGDKEVLVYRLRESLGWLGELERLRSVAHKTWGDADRGRARWSQDDLDWASSYYEDQQPYLESESAGDGEVDPFALRVTSGEQGLGIGLDGLAYCMTVLMRAAVIDFVDDLLDTTRFPQARGSMRCVDCGQFVGRRALGYGQLYCSDRCKKRAAKRRYRTRRAA